MAEMLPLEIDQVEFAAGGTAIISGISARIEAGPRTIILGPNGAGKSVLMRLCHGLLETTAGRIAWHGARNGDVRRHQAMVATPVINNLYEGKALLELVKGVEFNDLNTFSSIANASAMHEKLILHGIRYRPEYKQTIETEFIEIAGNAYLPRLQKIRKGAILDLEKVLLDAKLETIIASLRKGTLIYTHYLTGLVTPLQHAIEKAGFKVGLFTGEDKSGLDLFKKEKVDVLIGSVPLGPVSMDFNISVIE